MKMGLSDFWRRPKSEALSVGVDFVIDHSIMRIKNLGQIYEWIRLSGTCTTKRDLQDKTGLSWATVSGSISALVQKGFVTESDSGALQKSGRPAKCYDISSEQNLLIGVDINIESIHVALIDMKCRVLHSMSRMIILDEKDFILEATKEMIYAVIAQSQVKKDAILGIGFALMGAVDAGSGVALYYHLIKNWRNVDIKGIFEREFGLPVLVEHDPNCQAIAEINTNSEPLYDNLVFLRLSLGIGMSQIIAGQIFKGSSGSAGEIGHVCMDKNGPRCYCGKRGCVEAYASISGIARRVMEANKAENGLAERSPERDLSIVHRLAAAATAGDLQAKGYFDTAAEILGLSIGNLISLVNPSLVIIGGAFKQYAPLFMERLTAIAKEVCWPYSNVDIVLSSLPPNAAAVGAAALFIQRKIWETLF